LEKLSKESENNNNNENQDDDLPLETSSPLNPHQKLNKGTNKKPQEQIFPKKKGK